MSTPSEPIFLQALAGKPTARAPIWMLRQAGRYLPEYQALKKEKAQGNFWQLMSTPDLATEITLQPFYRFQTDAIILFSDILTPFPSMGFDLHYSPAPVIEKNAVEIGVHRLKTPQAEKDWWFTQKTIEQIKQHTSCPLIGFTGAPYTLACYALQQKKLDAHAPKRLFYSDPFIFADLMNKFSDAILAHMGLQIESGVSAVMLFDSWIGSLNQSQFEQMAQPYLMKILESLQQRYPEVPKIYLGLAGSHLLENFSKLPLQALSIDWRYDLSQTKKLLKGKIAIQGNLDYNLLFADQQVLFKEVKVLLMEMRNYPGFIFNLGHGLIPATPVQQVADLVKFVQNTRYDSLQ